MLTLILGRGKTGKTRLLLEAVRDCAATGMAQRIVIVPEQLSHQTERALGELCGDRISFVSEVLSFTRLQNRVSSIYGGGARQVLDKGGRILAARLALGSIHSRLKVFASAAGKADFLTGMVNMIDEFKSYNVTPEQLLEASEQSDGMFAQKLRELAEIMGAYEAVMARGTCDPRDKLQLLRDKLLVTDYAAGRHFFVDGFTDFSAQELGILEALLRRSGHLTVALPCDPDDPDSRLFQPGRETATRLTQMASKLGEKVEIVRAEHHRALPEPMQYLEQNLFTYNAPAFSGENNAIILQAAEDRLSECRHCAAELRRLAGTGLRWRDMAVAVGDTGLYGPLMEAVTAQLGVPLYTGMKAPIQSYPAVAAVLCALEAATEGMEPEPVNAYLSAGYSGITPDECDALENYAYTWAIRGQKWQKPWTEHPEGYDGRRSESTEAELQRLNTLRDTAIGPLLHLSARLKSAGNTEAQVAALYGFFEEIRLFEQVSQRVEQLSEQGRLEAAQETAQIWNTLMECLGQIVSVLGQTAQSGGEFLKLLRLALDQYEIGTIPATLDAVSFGTVESVRGSEPKVLFILGTNEGVIPAGPAGTSLLTERERGILLDQMHMELAPDSEGVMERQLLTAYSAMTAPTQRLYVSYASASAAETLQPSFLFGRLQKLFPHTPVEQIGHDPADAMTPEALAEVYLTAEEIGLTALQESIRRAFQLSPELEETVIRAKAASLPRDLLVTRELAGSLFGNPVTLTASRLDQLGNCPLNFFLNYGLKARPRKEASFDAAEFGTFLHYILEKTVRDLTQKPQMAPLTPEESGALVEAYMEQYLLTRLQDTEELSARQQYLYQRNGQEAKLLLTEISQELSVSQFRPCAFELQFGRGKALPPLEVAGTLGRGLLDGTVDRADLWKGPEGDFLRIVDYKSGTKKFDYTDLLGGVGMQLLLYLFALERNGIAGISQHPIPAGALYFPAKRAVLSADGPVDETAAERLRQKSGVKRTGLVLADETVLGAMEQGEGRYLPIQKKKSGLGDYAISPQQMQQLEHYIDGRMTAAVDQVYGGDFSPKPFYRGPSHDPCQWCDYQDVCQKDSRFRREHYQPTVPAKDFWKLIGGEDNG